MMQHGHVTYVGTYPIASSRKLSFVATFPIIPPTYLCYPRERENGK